MPQKHIMKTEKQIQNKIKDEVKHYINDSLMFTLGELIKAEIEQKFVPKWTQHGSGMDPKWVPK